MASEAVIRDAVEAASVIFMNTVLVVSLHEGRGPSFISCTLPYAQCSVVTAGSDVFSVHY